jgi:hypothetical protein
VRPPPEVRRAIDTRMIALALALLAAVFAPVEHPWAVALLAPPLLLSDALLGLATVALLVVFLLLVLGMMGTEERLNARGETLFPGQKRFDLRAIRARTDAALLAAVRELVAGGEPLEVLGRLEAATHRGDAMPPGRARECYDEAVGALERAAGSCRILEWEARQGRTQGATRWLCLARVELRAPRERTIKELVR